MRQAQKTLSDQAAIDRRWWTVQQIAAHYGVSLRSVYQAIDEGRLGAHRFGAGRGGIRVADADRQDWEKKCRHTSQSGADHTVLGSTGIAARLVAKHLEL